MDTGTQCDRDEPIWARSDAFPEAPQGCGWMDPKGRLHPLDDAQLLLKAIAEDEVGQVMLVWSEGHSHLILPEELEGAERSVYDGREIRYSKGLRQSGKRLVWGSLLLAALVAHQLWSLWHRLPEALALVERAGRLCVELISSVPLGMALLLWFALLFMPWYQARKDLGEWRNSLSGDSKPMIPTLRFEAWLMLQQATVTRVLAACMIVVWLAQSLWCEDSVVAAGLVKTAYHHGEYWRLLTAPWIHGNFLHFMFNFLALLYLGKRVELLARWPHLLLVLMVSMLAGGILSARFLMAPSVGISGGLMGWLGFLLVFETLHRRLVTRSARRRLLAGVLLTLLMGIIGYRFIDNAAHLGGLFAGMIYGLVVFPSSASAHRPKVLGIDRLAGFMAGLALCGAFLLAVAKLLQ